MRCLNNDEAEGSVSAKMKQSTQGAFPQSRTSTFQCIKATFCIIEWFVESLACPNAPGGRQRARRHSQQEKAGKAGKAGKVRTLVPKRKRKRTIHALSSTHSHSHTHITPSKPMCMRETRRTNHVFSPTVLPISPHLQGHGHGLHGFLPRARHESGIRIHSALQAIQRLHSPQCFRSKAESKAKAAGASQTKGVCMRGFITCPASISVARRLKNKENAHEEEGSGSPAVVPCSKSHRLGHARYLPTLPTS
ncbi:hypothetical protein ACJQWK_01716 [Exserohilum turcicum]